MATNIDNNKIFQIILIVLAGCILFALISYYNTKQSNVQHNEQFYQQLQQEQISQTSPQYSRQYQPPAYPMPSGPSAPDYSNQEFKDAQGYSNQEFGSTQGVDTCSDQEVNPLVIMNKQNTDAVKPADDSPVPAYRSVDYNTNLPADCFPKDRLTADDLLPADAANSKWAQVNPAGQGDVSNQNFLTSGWAIGINTVSGSLRNANLQLRSEPPNPRVNTWPIMQSTISPDVMRKSLSIGEDY